MATIKIKWTVYELANVMGQFDTQKVYRSTTGQSGAYSEITDAGTRVDFVADQTEYEFDDTSGSASYWYKISYLNSTTPNESELSDPIPATGGGNYVSVADIRDEGVLETVHDDARVLSTIRLAESFIEKVTGRWFYPRLMEIKLNGTDSDVLPVPPPIISITDIRMLYEPIVGSPTYNDISVDAVRVYNRHLTQGLLDPDDREAPKLVFEDYDLSAIAKWWPGSQNVVLTGYFGYTQLGPNDTAAETSEGSQVPVTFGSCPPEIADAAKRIVVLWLPERGDLDAQDDAQRRFNISRIKTRDQEIQYSAAASAGSSRVGWATGDPSIDILLAAFRRPPSLGAV
jgi:hypothetical protein